MIHFNDFIAFRDEKDFKENTRFETDYYSEAMNSWLYNRPYFCYHDITIKKPTSYPAFFEYNGVEFVEISKAKVVNFYKTKIKKAQEAIDKLKEL